MKMEMNTKEFYTQHSKVFCMSPWTHLHGLPTGDVIPCCLSPFEANVGNLKKESIIQVWNSEKMRELRRNMLNDVPTPDVCNRCYSKGTNKFSTLRDGLNAKYAEKYYDVVQSTEVDGSVPELNIVHWDFRFSNICNLKCRTCGPDFSTPWYDDFLAVHNIDKAQYGKGRFLKIVEDKDQFWDMIDPLYPHVESIHFAGGEPLLMDEHYRMINRFLEEGNTDLEILYSTNFTVMKYKGIEVPELWKNFSDITLSISVDGFGEYFDLIRSGGNWADVEKNFELLTNDPRMAHIKYRIHPTVSILNIFHITDLHELLLNRKYIIKDGLKTDPENYYSDVFMINPLIYPDHYNIQALPMHIKDKAAEKIRKHIEWLDVNHGIIGDGFENLITYMYEKDDSANFEEFKKVTAKLDTIRGENMAGLLNYLEI